MNIEIITTQAMSGIGCSRQDALLLAENADLSELVAAANLVREKYFGNKVRLCMIINAKSGVCDMDCSFCCQSGHNSAEAPTYPFMLSDKIADYFTTIDMSGVHNCGVVTSGGKLSGSDIDTFIASVGKVKDNVSFQICSSFGRLNADELTKLKNAGVLRYHHNLETSEEFYPQVCSTQKWSERLATVRTAIDMGMAVCCGGLFGLGESWSDRIDLAATLYGLGVDSIPMNFLYPHSGTPLGDSRLLSAEEALRIIAVFRLMLPDRTIRICGGRAKILGDRQNEIFAAGANAMMTGNYLTTTGELPTSDKEMIEQLGMEIE